MRSVSEPIVSKTGSRAAQSASGMCSTTFLWKLLAFALGKAGPEGLHGPTDVVYELRAPTDQRLTRADDDRQVSLGVLTTMFEWVE
jgi:hypothetical protein